jgi:hypothetical protein
MVVPAIPLVIREPCRPGRHGPGFPRGWKYAVLPTRERRLREILEDRWNASARRDQEEVQMSSPTNAGGPEAVALGNSMRRELLRLAKIEDEIAAGEAATVPYWAPSPATVLGHRLAATALRDSADQIRDPHAATTS